MAESEPWGVHFSEEVDEKAAGEEDDDFDADEDNKQFENFR